MTCTFFNSKVLPIVTLPWHSHACLETKILQTSLTVDRGTQLVEQSHVCSTVYLKVQSETLNLIHGVISQEVTDLDFSKSIREGLPKENNFKRILYFNVHECPDSMCIGTPQMCLLPAGILESHQVIRKSSYRR